MIRVTIVEDNHTIRYGLKEFISDADKFECVGEFSNCEEMLKELPNQETDIILMDIDLPGISGIDGIREIKKIVKSPKIIILTIHSESENLFEALATGACGYLEKKTPPSQMLKTIYEVYCGKSNMNTYIARKVLAFFTNKNKSIHASEKIKGITESEYNILKSLTSGNSPKAISNISRLPIESIYNNFYSIYEKLHLQFEVKKVTML